MSNDVIYCDVIPDDFILVMSIYIGNNGIPEKSIHIGIKQLDKCAEVYLKKEKVSQLIKSLIDLRDKL